jgi:hypothetical protein
MLQSLAIWQQEVSKGLATTLQHIAGFYSALSAACDKKKQTAVLSLKVDEKDKELSALPGRAGV